MEHRVIPPGQVGVPYNWRVANAAARNALVVSSDDNGKLLQQDDGGSPSYWVLWAAPSDWRPVSGAPGAPGESFDPDEVGPIAERGAFDNEPPPFSYLADDEGMLYFRIGEAGNWSAGISFGQGPKGDDGDPGVGVPVGGDAGQFLRKTDATDFNTYWGEVTSADVGLEAFDGFTPATLPISDDTQESIDLKANDADVTSALDTKVDKVTGLGLSQESFTTAEKTKLSGIASGATVNATDSALRDRSTHTGTQAISTVTNLQSELDNRATDAELSSAVSTLNAAISGREPSIPAGAVGEFLQGDKTWANFAATVRSTVLTGLTAGSNVAISATQTLLAALANLQAQISAQLTAIGLKADKGAIVSSGLTMATARLLGRNTASTGAVEEITLGTGLSMTGTTLNASAAGVSSATAWVNFNGTGTVAIRDAYNVSSITDLGVGLYRIIFSTPMTNTNYSVVGIPSYAAGEVANRTLSVLDGSKTINGFDVRVTYQTTLYDAINVDIHVFGGR